MLFWRFTLLIYYLLYLFATSFPTAAQKRQLLKYAHKQCAVFHNARVCSALCNDDGFSKNFQAHLFVENVAVPTLREVTTHDVLHSDASRIIHDSTFSAL